MTNQKISRIAMSAAVLLTLAWTAPTKAKSPAAPAQAQAAAVQVKIDNFSFSPREITVAPGTKVTWVNNDDVPHTVTSTADAFHSKALDTDDQFSFTFDKPGTYDYYCTIHSKMTAKVIVR